MAAPKADLAGLAQDLDRRSVQRVAQIAAHRVQLVDFGASGRLAGNLNTPADLAALGMTASGP